MCGPTTARVLPWRLLTDRSHRATVASIPMIEICRALPGGKKCFCVTRHYPGCSCVSYWAQEQRFLRRPRKRRPFSPNIFGLDFHDPPMPLDLIHISALTDIAVAKVSGALDFSQETCVTLCLLPSFRHASGFG
jgi:hypothetical protein